MNKTEKSQVIENLKEKFSSYEYFYLADAKGLTVDEVNTLRQECYDKEVEYKVVKNTLAKIALESIDGMSSEIFDALKGPTSIFFTKTANVPAKILKEYKKTHEKPVLKAAYIEGALYLGDDKVSDLASLKSKEEMIGDVISLLQAPVVNVVSALQSGGNTISGLVKALSEREEKQ